jgi:hypothetical protein
MEDAMSSVGLPPDFLIVLADQMVFALAELPKHVPLRRGGKKLHSATGFRWAKHGLPARDGSIVKLPTIQVAGTKCTSIEAFQWFCDRLSGAAAPSGRAPGPRAAAARRRAQEATDRALDRLGL